MIVVPEDTQSTVFKCLLSSPLQKWLWTPGTGSHFGEKMPLTAWVSLRKGSPLLLRSNKTLLSNTGLKNWRSVYSSTPNESLSLQPHDCSSPGSSVNGILQTRILEWVAIPFSRRSSQPRDQTRVSTLQADALPSKPPGKPWFPMMGPNSRIISFGTWALAPLLTAGATLGKILHLCEPQLLQMYTK